MELRSGLLAGSEVGVIPMHALNMRYKYWCIHTVLYSNIVWKVFLDNLISEVSEALSFYIVTFSVVKHKKTISRLLRKCCQVC